ncbi:MAG: DNA polymerase III subunit delta' [Novosphingobium sp.]|nr:DNA polymerase III subunit delta' [Novosphingobium sp.]
MTLAGHDEAWREWRAALAGGRMHHGWIVAGRRGLGKASFAFAAAAELVARGGARSFEPRAHPDILVLEPLPDGEDEERKRAEGKPYKTKRNIAVDQVRAMQRRLTTRPTLGERRAVIVDAADELERGAANALLKSLEEPPAGTIFLLVAHRPGRLPATIRSRCRMLRLAELDAAAVGQALDLAMPGLTGEARSAAVAVVAGSPGAAIEFAARELTEAYRLMTRIACDGDPDFALRGALLGEIGQRPDRDQQLAAIEAARMALLNALPEACPARAARIVEAHSGLARLLSQAPTANFDPAALMLEIGGLLASAAADREAA